MKTLISWIPLLFVSCVSPINRSGVPTLPVSPAVTKEVAVQTSIKEVQKRKIVLPAGYQTDVSASFMYQETGPTIPVYMVSFSRGDRMRTPLYEVAVNRNNGKIHFFSNLLTLKPAG
jgi:hypothetical protein